VLVVEADAAFRDTLLRAAGVRAGAEAVGDFQAAYARLCAGTLDLLVTNLRLHANVEGLQLAYVAASAGYPTRVLVYGERAEPWVIHELQRTGAFFETRARVQFALPSYARAELPVLDRRNPVMPDRRASYRGGRRASDVPVTPG
jgi:hypothetical protein